MPNPHPNDMKDPRLAKSLSGGQFRNPHFNYNFNLPFDEKNYDRFV